MYDVIMTTSSTSLRHAIDKLISEVNEKKKEGWKTTGGIDTSPKIQLCDMYTAGPSFYYACQAIEKD